jgi:hypothetical protein
VASYYYLHHTTMATIQQRFKGQHLNHKEVSLLKFKSAALGLELGFRV